MNIDLSGKTAVVCGSSKGIGKAIAHELASNGASCILLARDKEKLEQVLSALPAVKAQVHRYIVADFSDPANLIEQLKEVIEKAVPEILINNTGGPAAGPVLGDDYTKFSDTLERHLETSHRLAQLLVPGMTSMGYGRIINIISSSVRQPIKGLGVSNTVRAAMASWAKTLSMEVATFGITVNNLLPGYIETERLHEVIAAKANMANKSVAEMSSSFVEEIPAGRFGKPEEMAYLASFLASPAGGYINGSSIPVDGGKSTAL